MWQPMKLPSGNNFKAIGVMSGTSLDGLDIAACEFEFTRGKWKFSISEALTIAYNSEWLEKLKKSPHLSCEHLIELHSQYGRFIGLQINKFIGETGFTPDLVASHGHTIFHQPEKHFTFQLGSGTEIAASTQITTVADFRSGDVALRGQGAPLVPIGDKLLFSDFDSCLNLGGFANISFEKNNCRIAFDICPVNIILNHFAEKQGLPFDKNGELGRKGIVNHELLKELNNIKFYHQEPPRSLGREWIDDVILPVINSPGCSEEDKCRTIYEHIAEQISKSIQRNGNVLITGGGAFNSFLIELIRKKTKTQINLPDPQIINFKEALIFAFLGVLKIREEINCLSSVTGASKDSSTGVIFHF